MRNIKQFIHNYDYFDDRFGGEDALTLTLKEKPDYCIHIYSGYIYSIHENPQVGIDGIWKGFTKDTQEFARSFGGKAVEIDLDEYIEDLLLYQDVDFTQVDVKETQEVYNLILDFLKFAKELNQTVVVEYD